jgi:hypothetical protein
LSYWREITNGALLTKGWPSLSNSLLQEGR